MCESDLSKCSLPKEDACDGLWMAQFTIFHAIGISNETAMEDSCCGMERAEWKGRTCQLNNDACDRGDASMGQCGQTGFWCGYVEQFMKEIEDPLFEDPTWDTFNISITNSEVRGNLKDNPYLLDNSTNLPWYDSGNQWLKDTCKYGAAMDQMTMTYVSFTGYMRYLKN